MTLNARFKLLQRCPLFSSIPENDLRALAETMQEERFTKGEIICDRGDPADRIFIVMRGNLEVRVALPQPHVVLLEAGDLFGEYGMFDEGFRTATVISREETVLLALDYARFRAFLLYFPEAMLAILGSTERQLLASQRRANFQTT